MQKGLPKLKTDTWAVIGAFSGWSAVIVTVMLALHSATNARISEQSARIDAQGDQLGARIDAQGARLGARIDAQDGRIDMLQDTMRNEHALILDSLAGIAQRVSYIEGHLGIGRAVDTEPADPP